MILSILIPSIPERVESVAKLLKKLLTQIGDQPVEVICVLDNKTQPLGYKRNAMMRMAKGHFLTHIDDDDDIADDYIATVIPFLQANLEVDVVCIQSQAHLDDDNPFVVRTSLQFENEQTNVVDGKRPDIKRKPWHWCIWRTKLARQGRFPKKFYGEDWYWIQQMLEKAKTEAHIDKVLHYYFKRSDPA